EVKARARGERITKNLRASEAALAAETERLSVTLYCIGDGVITTDVAGRILSLNKVAEQLTTWPQAEAMGKPLAELFKVIHEHTRQPFVDPVEAVLQSGTISNGERSG